MSLRARRMAAIFGGIGIGVAILFFARQPARAQGMVRATGNGNFHFGTKIGSFKLLGAGDEGVTGHLEYSGRGTVLITGIDKPPETTGSLKLEYSYVPLKKYCYHGLGTFKLDGKWRSVQWFGTDLTGSFNGRGKFRLVGEFDKDLNTGYFWTDDPKKQQYWPANSVAEYVVPGYTSTTATPQAMPQPTTTPSGK